MMATKRAGIPTTTGIPASTTADYRGNFGLVLALAIVGLLALVLLVLGLLDVGPVTRHFSVH
jgi:tetrahydromethanopterin S-methyltransferase subunit B